MTTVHSNRLIAAPADQVWALVRDFAGLERWLPSLPSPVEMTGDPGRPGAERAFRQSGEIFVVERLVTLNDEARTTSYSIVKSPAPMSAHLATISVTEQPDGALVEWQAEFDAEEQVAEMLGAAMVSGTFEPGLQHLAAICEAGPAQ